jgi:hypothetical protein
MGLIDSLLCSRCGAEDETLAHVCECEALVSLRHATLGSFFLDPEDVQSLSLGAVWDFSKGTGLLGLGAVWNFSKGTGLLGLEAGLWEYKGPVCRQRCIGSERVLNPITNII